MQHLKAWVESAPHVHHHESTERHPYVETETLATTEIHVETQTYVSVSNETTSKKKGKKTNQRIEGAHKIRHDKHKKEKGLGRKKGKVSTSTTSTTAAPSTPMSNPDFVDDNSDYIIYDPNGSDDFTTTVHPELNSATAQLVPTESITEPTNETNVESDRDDNDSENGVKVSRLGTEATLSEGISTLSTSTTRKPTTTATRRPRSSTTRRPRVHKPAGDLGRCSSFSDISCFDLQENGKELDACCYKGVYLTGVCNRDLCSSKTYHLCCFQKYQQVKIL